MCDGLPNQENRASYKNMDNNQAKNKWIKTNTQNQKQDENVREWKWLKKYYEHYFSSRYCVYVLVNIYLYRFDFKRFYSIEWTQCDEWIHSTHFIFVRRIRFTAFHFCVFTIFSRNKKNYSRRIWIFLLHSQVVTILVCLHWKVFLWIKKKKWNIVNTFML